MKTLSFKITVLLVLFNIDVVARQREVSRVEPHQGQRWRQSHRTYVFAVHVVVEAEAVGGRVGDAIGVLGRHVEEGAEQSRLVALLARPRRLDVHVEAWEQ